MRTVTRGPRRRLARVDAGGGLGGRGQPQGQDVADVLVVGGQEVRGDDRLVRPAGVGHPAREHHRAFHGLERVRVGRREAEVHAVHALHRGPVVDGEQPERADLGQRSDLRPVEAGLVRQHDDGRGQRPRPQPAEGRVAAPGPGHRGQHDAGGQRDEQREHDQRPPASSKVQSQPRQRHPHAAPPPPSRSADSSRSPWSKLNGHWRHRAMVAAATVMEW